MIEELTDKNYENLITRDEKPIFIDFYSPTCGPCQTLMSVLPKIESYANDKDVYVFKCNVASNPKIANKFQIQSVPFTLIVDKDKKIQSVNAGLLDFSYYISLIDKHSPLRPKGFFEKLFS